MRLGALAATTAMWLCACDAIHPEPPSCAAGMPRASELLTQPAFANLKFHKRVDFDVVKGVGYDLWGDQKFEYGSGLQLTLVPAVGSRGDDDLCASAIALRIAAPPAGAHRDQIRVFVSQVAPRTGFDVARVTDAIESRVNGNVRFGLVARERNVIVEAGHITHPLRGDFFVVSFGWPSKD